MNKNVIFALFVLGLFVLGGCKGGETAGAPRTPFIGGTNGLIIDFMEGSPPEEVLDDSSYGFQALVKLKNDGEFTVEKNKVKVSLLGIDPNDFSTSLSQLIDKMPDQDVMSKRRDAEGNLIDGLEVFISFPDENSELVPKRFSGNTEFTLRADVCYMYETNAVSKICILEDLINIRENSICDPSETKTVYSSGGPVQVTNLKETIAGKDRIGITFDVVHNNNGNVLKFGDGSDAAHCPKDPRERRNAENRVKVTVNTGMSGLSCVGLSGGSGNDGYVTLSSGKRSITCYQDLTGGRSDFEKDIQITLQYNYEDYKDKKILVKHLTTE